MMIHVASKRGTIAGELLIVTAILNKEEKVLPCRMDVAKATDNAKRGSAEDKLLGAAKILAVN
jgi:hypothetical protein